MKITTILLTLVASLVPASSSFAQTAYGTNVGGGGFAGGIAGAAPQLSTTAGDVSPISGGNGGVGGTPGNSAAAGTSAGPGNSGAYSPGTARYR